MMRDFVRVDMGRKPKAQPSKPTEDWGTRYPEDYVVIAWRIWRRSGGSVYPNGKCYDEQPRKLILDFIDLDLEYAYQAEYLKDEKE
jgi:hypothetical protein